MGNTSEYCTRPLLHGLVYEISERRISICTEDTCFISAGICDPLEKAALLEQYQRVRRLAKKNGVRISYTTHVRKTICEKWEEYETAFHDAQSLFHQMIEQARLVERRGIHYGWRDDQELERLNELDARFQRYMERSSAVSLMAEVKHHMDALERELTKFSDGLCMISL